MTVTRCASSHLMTELLTWRNPQGADENWYWSKDPQDIENGWEHAGKVISTEICLVLLVVTSAVETVAYATLAFASLALYPCTDRPYVFFAKLLKSSSFTIIWALADALFINFAFPNISTHESFARNEASRSPALDKLYRPEDYQYIMSKRPNAVQNDPLVKAGADFMQQHVLANESAETIALFEARALRVRNYLLGKAVYIYAFEAKKNEEIPNYFKQATKDYILSLRNGDKEEVEPAFTRLVSDPTQFNIDLQTETAQSILDQLQELASKEPLDPLMDLDCWERTFLLLNQ